MEKIKIACIVLLIFSIPMGIFTAMFLLANAEEKAKAEAEEKLWEEIQSINNRLDQKRMEMEWADRNVMGIAISALSQDTMSAGNEAQAETILSHSAKKRENAEMEILTLKVQRLCCREMIESIQSGQPPVDKTAEKNRCLARQQAVRKIEGLEKKTSELFMKALSKHVLSPADTEKMRDMGEVIETQKQAFEEMKRANVLFGGTEKTPFDKEMSDCADIASDSSEWNGLWHLKKCQQEVMEKFKRIIPNYPSY
ncbi:hypothetical protein JW899_02095 [Candidatus Uhrbacteria bacterium]|nr:hypothetical protein [Candidatus Uhrbacteria bacterium]